MTWDEFYELWQAKYPDTVCIRRKSGATSVQYARGARVYTFGTNRDLLFIAYKADLLPEDDPYMGVQRAIATLRRAGIVRVRVAYLPQLNELWSEVGHPDTRLVNSEYGLDAHARPTCIVRIEPVEPTRPIQFKLNPNAH